MTTEEKCPHWSWSGVDQTPIDDPSKVWECDHCGATRCVNCANVVSQSWLDTDEWRESRHCPTCLFGPPPTEGDPHRMTTDPQRIAAIRAAHRKEQQ